MGIVSIFGRLIQQMLGFSTVTCGTSVEQCDSEMVLRFLLLKLRTLPSTRIAHLLLWLGLTLALNRDDSTQRGLGQWPLPLRSARKLRVREERGQAAKEFVGLLRRQQVACLLNDSTLDILRDRLQLAKGAFARREGATEGQNRHL